MIAPERLYHFLGEKAVSFYTGVPDSLLRHFLQYLQEHAGENNHVITANEGLAIGLASGYHFATGRLPLVYLQNSGLGNTINPLTSLADQEMYSVPLLLMIGWRGRPSVKDEPQHVKMGRITRSLLDVLEIPVYELSKDEADSFDKISRAIDTAMQEKRPVALLVPDEIFETYHSGVVQHEYSLVREDVIKRMIEHLDGSETVLCTTGKIGREFFEQNKAAGGKMKKYFLSVGAMGHASHVALGVKMQTGEKVVMLDGDGAVLMQMGALPVIAGHAADGFVHVVLNNGSHESVGAQPTQGFFADLCAVAKGCGYKNTICITGEGELTGWLVNLRSDNSTQFVEIRINNQSRKELGRPEGSPGEWKRKFMGSLKTK